MTLLDGKTEQISEVDPVGVTGAQRPLLGVKPIDNFLLFNGVSTAPAEMFGEFTEKVALDAQILGMASIVLCGQQELGDAFFNGQSACFRSCAQEKKILWPR